jgi:hypothetical protein
VARRLRPPSTESLFVAALVLFGFRLGAHAIGDNSMFAHLRTGRDIAYGLGIPRTDPYSFTAHGHPWVVQSWLAEATYGLLYRLGGLRLVIVEQALLCAVLAWLIVRLARAGTPLRTGLAGAIALGAGAAYWTQRPLLFGLICFALLVLVVDRRRSPWWLVPLFWLWVNTHGSFPLGMAWLGARAVGEGLDRRALPRDLGRYAVATVGGLAAACVNPLGPRLLTFAFTIGQKREVFRDITEWHSPNFQRDDGIFTLVFLVLALVVLLRGRVRWADALPAVGFLALGLLALRNIPPAAIALAPAVGAALRVGARAAEPAEPSQPASPPPTLNLIFLAVVGVAMALFAASALTGPPLNLHGYPVAAIGYMDRHHLFDVPHRAVEPDIVGDYLVLRSGRRARVFIDDRFDMYPVAVSDDFTTLLHGGRNALAVLDRRRIDVVLWDAGGALPALLETTGGWQAAYRAGGWVVLRRV